MCIRDRINTIPTQSQFVCSFPCCCCKMTAGEAAKTILIVDLITMIFLFLGRGLILVLPYLIIAGIALYKIQRNQVHWSRKWAPTARLITWIVTLAFGIFLFLMAFAAERYIEHSGRHHFHPAFMFAAGGIILSFSILQIFISLLFRRAIIEMDKEGYYSPANIVMGIPVQMTPGGFPEMPTQELFDQSNTDKGTNQLVNSSI
eukprot:TRINITY_DN1097_c0_g1_i6.p1 TRINITY_DN1097_c0_g1~~TRINITY_DN1097_c0_g1_i6.p1  ORF type:complete len:222 (-),score=30.71 TRINITY_DN1097_c0_g1_i6:98-706(-)